MMTEPHGRRRRREKAKWREYRRRHREIQEEFNRKNYDSRKEMLRHLHALEEEYHIHRRRRKQHDFDQYYRNFKIVRPMPIILVLSLWLVLFFNAGLSTSLGVFLMIFAIVITVGSAFQIIFNFRLEKRVLQPIDNLKKGMREIAGGNYNIQVEESTHSYIDVLIEDFNDMAQKLREAERLKAEYEENRKELIANISHDLKTPITSIQGYIEAICDAQNISDEKMEKYLKIIHNNIVYMNRLIDDLFLFSKLDMQKLSFTYSEVSVKPFMQDLMEEFRLDLEEKGIDFTYEDRLAQDCTVRIDTKRFHQVLRNVIDNAVKYGPEKGLGLQTELFLESGRACVSITDNGPGIPEEKIGQIFNRFYRLDMQRTKDISSTGLGLAIAKELIEMQGGSIRAANMPEGGTCFTVTLPDFCAAGGTK